MINLIPCEKSPQEVQESMEGQASSSAWESQEDFQEEVVLDMRIEGRRGACQVDIEGKNGPRKEEYVQRQRILRE